MTLPFLRSEAFRQSRAVLLTALTNKIGSIGLSLVPILLVSRGVSTGQGTLVLSCMKGVLLLGTLAGGAAADRLGARRMTLLALLLSALGLGGLPFPRGVWLILLCGVAAQCGDSLVAVSQRLLLIDLVERAHHREALGWMKTVNNFGQIFCYALSAAGSAVGLMPLMLFDASTSLLAFLLGRRILPRKIAPAASRDLRDGLQGEMPSKRGFFVFAVVYMAWALIYELFLAGGAGRLEVLHPGSGLRLFSLVMFLNTVLCAGLAVQAARFFSRAFEGLVLGAAVSAAGLLLLGWGAASRSWVFAAALFITTGELAFSTVAQHTLIRLTPGGKDAGLHYSWGLALAQSGRIVGAMLAFPLLIHAEGLRAFTVLILGLLALMLMLLRTLRAEIELRT